MRNFVQLFNDSYERILADDPDATKFLDSFYQDFTERSPKIAEAFANTNMKRQRAMLKESLVCVFNFYVSKKSSDYLDQIAVRHSKRHLNIEPRMYHEWQAALVEALRKHDPQFNDDVELAWRVVFAPGIEYMRFHYDK